LTFVLVSVTWWSTENLKDLSPNQVPLTLIVWEFVLLVHVLEVFVTNLLIFTVIFDLDSIGDQSKLFILKDVNEYISAG
jgi:hypothetical protein